MQIKDIIIHHSGGVKANPYASTAHVTPQQISAYHKRRWDFPSKYIFDGSVRYAGYNFIYDPKTRRFTQCREIGEETAHTIGYNRSSVGICIIGNYSKSRIGSPKGTVDKLTYSIEQDITGFIYELIHGNKLNLLIVPNTKIDLSSQRVHAHRFYQPNTECYGTGILNNFFRDKLIEFEKKNIIFNLLKAFCWHLLDIQQKREIEKAVLGSSDTKECPGIVEVIN